MKYLKIFTILLGTLAMASCQPKDPEPEVNANPKDVVVTMAETEVGFKENKGIVNIPFNVKGKHDGYVSVTCELQEYGDSPAMDDAHYYISTKTVVVAAGDSIGYFQFALVDDNYENETRQFLIKLVSCEGGTIGDPNTCLVSLKDNDHEPYDRLSGEWYAHCEDFNGNPIVRKVVIDGYDEGEPGYGRQFIIKGLVSGDTEDDPYPIEARFAYNPSTQEGSISIVYGSVVGKTKTSGGSEADVELIYLIPPGYIGDTGSAVFTWNDDFSEIILESSPLGDYAEFIGLYADIEAGKYYITGNPATNVTKLVKYN